MSKKVVNLGKVKGRTLDLKVEDNIIKKKYDDEAEWEDLAELPDGSGNGVLVVDKVSDLPAEAKQDAVAFVKTEELIETVNSFEKVKVKVTGMADDTIDLEIDPDAMFISDVWLEEKYPEFAGSSI